ncbi:hypothetical protein BRD00_07175 [Halobacteriales archaeon QS_8_69_26]|nr:MAG: hypothetical protein BRD00_07175 [Halobacteriales archaeon QS_8_69_26]
MVRLPWGGSDEDGDDDDDDLEPENPPEGVVRLEPVVACEFDHVTLFVYDDHVHVERPDGSKFEDKSIPLDEVTGVEFAEGIVVGYLQVCQVRFENDGTAMFKTPVDANTCHFRRGSRECAKRARDAILERAGRGDGG